MSLDRVIEEDEADEGRSETDVARLVLEQAEAMIAMAVAFGLDELLPTLENVRSEALSVLSGRSSPLHS